jgi:hypothetical protein
LNGWSEFRGEEKEKTKKKTFLTVNHPTTNAMCRPNKKEMPRQFKQHVKRKFLAAK